MNYIIIPDVVSITDMPDTMPSSEPNPEELAEQRDLIAKARKRMTVRERFAVEMIANGNTEEKIAEAMDMEPAAVRKMVSRMRARLRDELL